MAVCPKCGGSNFRYELRSAGTRSRTNYYRTGVRRSWVIPAGRKTYRSQRQQKAVGMCADCGYIAQERSAWFYILCVLVWPIALSVWFYRSPAITIPKKWKLLILAVFWIVLIVVCATVPNPAA